MQKINDAYSIIKGQNDPLSCDVALIEINDKLYIFEAGSNLEIVKQLNEINSYKTIIISHFHPDHMGNLSLINYDKLYVGDNTYKYCRTGEVVRKDILLDNELHLFKLSSCHAKGSIGLEIGDYAFLGDATSPTHKKGKLVYNVQMLKEEITQLESLNAKYFVFSHKMEETIKKEVVIDKLYKIYQKREKNNPYILI